MELETERGEEMGGLGSTGPRNGEKTQAKICKENSALERDYERIYGDRADMHCDTLAFIENNAAPITMQIMMCTHTNAPGGMLPVSHYKL